MRSVLNELEPNYKQARKKVRGLFLGDKMSEKTG